MSRIYRKGKNVKLKVAPRYSVDLPDEGLAGLIPEGVKVVLPSNSSSLSSLMRNLATAVKLARGGRHGIIVASGDSTTVGATDTHNDRRKTSFPNVLARQLRALGVTINTCNFLGSGNLPNAAQLSAYDSRINLGPFVPLATGGIGNYTFIENTNNAGPMTFACDQPVDTAVLCYLTDLVGNGTMTLDIGGAALGTVDCNQAKAFRVSAPIKLADVPGYYTLRVKRATNGAIFPSGVIAWNSRDPGISIINAGWSGGTIVNDTASTGWSLRESLAALAPDLTLINHVINEWGTGVALNTFNTKTAELITAAKRGGLGDVALWLGPQSAASYTSLAVQQQYLDAYMALVNSSAVPLLDCRDVFGPNVVGPNYVDAIGHPTELGYAKLGEAIGRVLSSAGL